MALARSSVFTVLCVLNSLIGAGPFSAHADDYRANPYIQEDAHKPNGLPLYDAALSGKSAKVKRLIASGAKVNATDKRHRTPLHAAVLGGDIESVRLLLRAGSKVDAICTTCNYGCIVVDDGLTGTPLHWAVQMGQVKIARLLIGHGANVNSAQTRWEETPLDLVGQQGGMAMAALLLQHGARINAAGGFDHETPLYDACQSGKVETARVFLAHGADVNLTNHYGDAPLHAAVRGGYSDLVKLLLTTNVKLNLESRIGTKMLLPSGWSSEIGGTPLHIAIQGKHTEIARLLEAKGAVDTERDERGWQGTAHSHAPRFSPN